MQLASRAAEAEFLREVDHLALSNEREKRVHHSREMTQYRDENKRVPHVQMLAARLIFNDIQVKVNMVIYLSLFPVCV